MTAQKRTMLVYIWMVLFMSRDLMFVTNHSYQAQSPEKIKAIKNSMIIC